MSIPQDVPAQDRPNWLSPPVHKKHSVRLIILATYLGKPKEQKGGGKDLPELGNLIKLLLLAPIAATSAVQLFLRDVFSAKIFLCWLGELMVSKVRDKPSERKGRGKATLP